MWPRDSSEKHGQADSGPGRLPLYVTLALCAGIGAASLTLITPSLPSLQSELGITVTQLGVSQAVYLLCIALPQLFYGAYSDRIGRRKPLLLGLAVFVAGSIAATFAFDVLSLTFARFLQAIGASSGMVISRAVVRDMHPEGRMASVMGFLAMPMMVLPMIAPALGGLVQDLIGWRGNFWLLTVCGILLIAASMAWLPRESGAAAAQLTPAGTTKALLTSRRFYFFTFQFGLSSATNQLFFIVTPFVMERQFGLPPLAYGAWFSIPPLMYFAGNLISGIYAERLGIVRMVRVGSLGAGVVCAIWLLAFIYLPVASVELFLVMGSIALFHGLITPSAVAGATGAISTAFGFASGMAGFLQALLCAMTVLAASVAEIEHAELLVWWLASISLVCVMLSQTLLPRTAEHG